MVALIVWLGILGVISWFIETYLHPYIKQPFRALMHIVLIVIALLMVLSFFNLSTPFPR